MGNPKLPKEAYTIGWICPLEIEYTAALVMLDEEHDSRPERPPVDENIYSLGRIGEHNVVIASLPVMGNNAAATVATQMRNTFPNVQYVLLVGIGGGVPATTDNGIIRLGDVVVSKPMNGHSGAIQYDHGKAKVGEFQRTGALALPPRLLLNAAGDLAAKSARMRKDPVARHLKRFDTTVSGLRRYAFPGSSNDHLYEADYVHLDPRQPCAACGCDPQRRVRRASFDLDEEDTEPMVVVHRGTIASGELVIKNGLLRDELAAPDDIICFEMEAAGALAGSNCLVIRGISDYCDSHKNNEWQGYAAAVAAAYARQLLFHLPPIVVNAPTSLALKPDDSVNKERQMILDWLTTVNFEPQLHDLLNIRQKGSGEWFLQSQEFQNWLHTAKQTLYCTGIPGAGKTILMATVVDHLITSNRNHANVGIVYIFCNAKRKQDQTPLALMLSMLKQLAHIKSPLPETVVDIYRSFELRGTRPSLEGVVETLQGVISQFSKVYIVVDALDECHSPQGDYGPFLLTLQGLRQTTEVQVLATSRYSKNIEGYFEDAITAEIRANPEDLDLYLDASVLHLPALVRRDSELQLMIKEGIMKVADGMFLLAKLLLDGLADRTSRNSIMKALGRLPDGNNALDTAYQEAMDRIANQRQGFKDLALRVLVWLVHAKRPLTVPELQHALAISTSTGRIDPGDIEDADDMVSVCAGLVTVDQQGHIIRLVHYTAQEYLWKLKDKWFPDAEQHTTRACLQYLSLYAFAGDSLGGLEEITRRIEAHPLLQYATQFWGEHAVLTDFGSYEELAVNCLGDPVRVTLLAQLMHSKDGFQQGNNQDIPQGVTALQVAASFNLSRLADAMLDGGVEIDQTDSNGWTALHRAAECNSVQTVTLLLNRGAYIDHRAQYGGTALHRAATNGHTAVVAELLHRGALRDLEDNYGGTALHRAAKGGHIEVVRLLISHGSDIDRNYNGELIRRMAPERVEVMEARTMSYMPARKSRTSQHTVPNNMMRRYTGNAMHQAVLMGHRELTRLLLQSGADPFCLTPLSETVLHLAAETGNEHITQILLATDAVLLVNEQDARHNTPLSLAAAKGHEAVVRALLGAPGINVDNKDVLVAAKNGHDKILVMLLPRNSTFKGAMNSIAWRLYLATISGNLRVFQHLLDAEYIHLDDRDDLGRSILSYAAKRGHRSIFEFLLANNTTNQTSLAIRGRDDEGRTLLSLAAEGGDAYIARFILELDPAQLNVTDNQGMCPLSWAARNGRVEIVKLLLETADIQADPRDAHRNSPLIEAAGNGHREIVVLLLNTHSVDLRARNFVGNSAICQAVSGGHEGTASLLLQAGSVEPGSDYEWNNLLSLAVRSPRQPILEALCASGRLDLSEDSIDETVLYGLAYWGISWNSDIVIETVCTAPNVLERALRGLADLQESSIAVLRCLFSRDINLAQELRSRHIELLHQTGTFLLQAAARWRSPEPVRLLLAAHSEALLSEFPLSWAVEFSHLDIVRALLNLDPTLLRGLLSNIIAQSSVEVLDLLLSRGLDPDYTDQVGIPLLQSVALESRDDMVKLLWPRMRDPTVKDSSGDTVLHIACTAGSAAMVQFLLQTGRFDLNLPGENGMTPLANATRSAEVVSLLLATGQVSGWRDIHGEQSPLYRAANVGNLEVVRLLMAHATPSVEDRELALHTAICEGHATIVKYLITVGQVSLEKGWGKSFVRAVLAGHLYTVHTLFKHGIVLDASDISRVRRLQADRGSDPLLAILETRLLKRKRSISGGREIASEE